MRYVQIDCTVRLLMGEWNICAKWTSADRISQVGADDRSLTPCAICRVEMTLSCREDKDRLY